MNCCVEPVRTVLFVGEMVIELTTLLLTVSVVLCFMLLSVAVIVVLPMATAVAKPLASIVAMAGFEEAQVTVDVMSRVLPSPKTPLAEYCCVAAGLIDVFRGLMVKEATSLGPMKKLLQPARMSKRKNAEIR